MFPNTDPEVDDPHRQVTLIPPLTRAFPFSPRRAAHALPRDFAPHTLFNNLECLMAVSGEKIDKQRGTILISPSIACDTAAHNLLWAPLQGPTLLACRAAL